MGFVTLEVDLDHGRVIPRGSDTLPETASALLTLLHSEATPPKKGAGSVSDFVATWGGAFTMSASHSGDARLDYLISKHLK